MSLVDHAEKIGWIVPLLGQLGLIGRQLLANRAVRARAREPQEAPEEAVAHAASQLGIVVVITVLPYGEVYIAAPKSAPEPRL